jgi:membrane-bound lytic murein transglycosylase B
LRILSSLLKPPWLCIRLRFGLITLTKPDHCPSKPVDDPREVRLTKLCSYGLKDIQGHVFEVDMCDRALSAELFEDIANFAQHRIKLSLGQINRYWPYDALCQIEYASTRVIPARIKRAKQLMQRHAALLARIERQFGVPATLLMAIWTLESDNGTGDMGKLPVIRTLATLAHDCRRSELFQGELLAALQIVQRGDLLLRDLIGAYAGEIGQTQFLPSSYIKYGVDYDGNGHVDLRHSVPDVLASTANLLKTNGWQAGAPFGEGTANFEVMREWNRSVVYRKTMVLFAERLAEP